jgi:hypothetical protein
MDARTSFWLVSVPFSRSTADGGTRTSRLGGAPRCADSGGQASGTSDLRILAPDPTGFRSGFSDYRRSPGVSSRGRPDFHGSEVPLEANDHSTPSLGTSGSIGASGAGRCRRMGFPRDTAGWPGTQNRQGLSCAAEIPTLGPVLGAGGGGVPSSSSRNSDRRSMRLHPSCAALIPRAWQRRPGPRHRSRSGPAGRSGQRAARMATSPCTGSAPRRSTAPGSSPGPATTFAHQCTPYDRYTYRTPGRPNIERLRGVIPRNA